MRRLPLILVTITLVVLAWLAGPQLFSTTGGLVEAGAPEAWLRIVVILLVLAAAIFVILSKKYDDADRKWAYGVVGAILGYVLGNGGV